MSLIFWATVAVRPRNAGRKLIAPNAAWRTGRGGQIIPDHPDIAALFAPGDDWRDCP
jgi:hypothetical protein